MPVRPRIISVDLVALFVRLPGVDERAPDLPRGECPSGPLTGSGVRLRSVAHRLVVLIVHDVVGGQVQLKRQFFAVRQLGMLVRMRSAARGTKPGRFEHGRLPMVRVELGERLIKLAILGRLGHRGDRVLAKPLRREGLVAREAKLRALLGDEGGMRAVHVEHAGLQQPRIGRRWHAPCWLAVRIRRPPRLVGLPGSGATECATDRGRR